MSDGAKIEVDLWAKARSSDLHVFVQETHHARRLGGEYRPVTVEEWDAAFTRWLVAKGRVRASAVFEAWSYEPVEIVRSIDEINPDPALMDGAVVAHIGEPIDLGEMETVAADPDAAAERVASIVSTGGKMPPYRYQDTPSDSGSISWPVDGNGILDPKAAAEQVRKVKRDAVKAKAKRV
jgi:hypothetical protein